MSEIDKQQVAIDLIDSGSNLFISGSGGVGKSWVINKIKDQDTVLCAPTGIAALNIGGATAHKTFNLPFGMPTEEDIYKSTDAMYKLFSIESNISRIIIDEISMLRADYLDLIDLRLKRIRNNDLPFGGLQVVVFGDFYQLEPIVSDHELQFFYQCYETSFAFSSDAWDFPMVNLTKVYRQSDKRQVAILNSIRCKDRHSERALQTLQDEAMTFADSEASLHLTAYNKDADRINDKHYKRITQKEYTLHADYTGSMKSWEKDAPVGVKVKMKVGSRVLICGNNPNAGYVNGSRGEVIGITPAVVLVKLIDGREVKVVPFTWEKINYMTLGGAIQKHVEAYFTQMPLKLGWAISSHKSQSMTLDDVALDVGRKCFAHGQLYVALSRIRDLKRLQIISTLRPKDLIVHKCVVDFYANTKEVDYVGNN